MEKKTFSTRYLAEVALFVGIILVMKITGLSSVPVGQLVMTFTMIPIAIGSMLLGPLAGTILGAVFGLTSLYDAITGKSAMTYFFFQESPFFTVLLCVGTRALVGAVTGWLFRLLSKADKKHTWSYFAGGLAAPLLNTLFFMGFIVLVFYRTTFVQNLVNKLGASGPIMFVILVVGVQGLVEAATGLVIGGAIAKGVAHALKRDRDPMAAQKVVMTRSLVHDTDGPTVQASADDTLKLIDDNKEAQK
ncbi:MAG: ECF transporter S component [Clostridia bacterium]|nr:ECF transporter S component [Clostridia bacterium]